MLALLLSPPAGRAQNPYPQNTYPSQFRQPIRSYGPAQSGLQSRSNRITIGPSIPIALQSADDLIIGEPDSARRRQYVQQRVRSVVKVRLDGRGQVQDTLEYQAFNEQGRATEAGTSPGRIRRQWSYNAQGHCTALVVLPATSQPYTFITSYHPGLRRGQQEVLQPNGTRTVVGERQLYQHADTLLTEAVGHNLLVGNHQYLDYYQRSLRLQPHPDTVLCLTGFYDQNKQLTGSRVDYLLYQAGQLTESGRLDLGQAAKAQPEAGGAAGTVVPLLSSHQALLALRRGSGRLEVRRSHYDARRRLIKQENLPQAGTSREVLNTYNSLDQLIGQQLVTSGISSPTRSAFTVYSYSPTGLLLGETTNARSSKPVFYRYLYQYYR
ncbi:hypothetical protein [Hymenobacter persicinus]|uniref:Uncharacterized protein n=1 Tax=Hymenobacter persicinus TaxID=2025506 RepID=A0A4Q5LHJ3_9BACT|nr:hypothetical protein [Hymenobacter persicinus]RYU84306.1 hypothetical protein EWM57_01025 [Hymenobacter persicinus]